MSDPQYWLISITESNWNILQRVKKYGAKRELDKIKVNDFLVFYVIRSGKIKGVFRVESGWREEKDLLWADEKTATKLLYPSRIDIDPVTLGEVDFKEIVEKLSFVRNKDFPQVYLRRTPANFGKPIPKEDFELIVSELKK